MPELRLGLNDKIAFESSGRREFAVISHSYRLSLYERESNNCSSSTLPVTFSLPPGKGKSVELEDVKFHQCVRLARFENDRTISFIPPDGEFELMSYRLSQVRLRSHPGCSEIKTAEARLAYVFAYIS